MHAIASTLVLYSILIPTKNWFSPNQPLLTHIKSTEAVTLMMTDISGQNIDPTAGATAEIMKEADVDLKQIFPLSNPGTYIVYAVPKGEAMKGFVGTPLVIHVRADNRPGAPLGPMVVQIEAMAYAQMTTEKGGMTIAFYYDAAPHTIENFVSLAQGGFYDGLAFNKIVKDFIVQGGDPRNDGTGGPGYRLQAEFNDKQHDEGVISMSRQIDPNEPASMPRSEFANSAGSQFFICLNRENCKQLDGRYAAFGRVVAGMETVRSIAATPVTNAQTGKPEKLIKISKLEIRPVTAKDNPYVKLSDLATSRPAGVGP